MSTTHWIQLEKNFLNSYFIILACYQEEKWKATYEYFRVPFKNLTDNWRMNIDLESYA